MVVDTMTHKPSVQVKESDLRKPFQFLFGKECLGRYPWASAEFASSVLDKMLQRISDLQLNRQKSLNEAVKAVVEDSNFWFLNVYSPMERIRPRSRGRGGSDRGGQHREEERRGNQRSQPYQSPGKGKSGKSV